MDQRRREVEPRSTRGRTQHDDQQQHRQAHDQPGVGAAALLVGGTRVGLAGPRPASGSWAGRWRSPTPLGTSVGFWPSAWVVYDGAAEVRSCGVGSKTHPADPVEVQLRPRVQVVRAVDEGVGLSRSARRKPTATRAGMSSVRAITAIAAANCSQ